MTPSRDEIARAMERVRPAWSTAREARVGRQLAVRVGRRARWQRLALVSAAVGFASTAALALWLEGKLSL